MRPKTRKPAKMPEGRMGMLPAKAPLANPYVPFQEVDPPKYEARKGLIRGTMFPGLDLPFMGMTNDKLKPDTDLSQLQALAFAVQELALYLDTHRDDMEALEVYRAYQKMHRKAREQFEANHGPLGHGTMAGEEYRWLGDPWPWEYCANREG